MQRPSFKVQLASFLLAFVLPLNASQAASYEVSLTRKAKNLYKVSGQAAWVQTRYCYHYGYGDEAVVTDTKVVFVGSGDTCDLKKILRDASIAAGSYRVSVTHDDDDLYSTLEGVLLVTSGCYRFVFGQDAILRLTVGGRGSLTFTDDGQQCSVEAVLS